MKWFHDYAIREAARTSAATDQSSSALSPTLGSTVTAEPALAIRGVPTVNCALTSVASLATVGTVATSSNASEGRASSVAQPTSSGTAALPDQYSSRLFRKGCVMSRPHPTSVFDPFAGTGILWPSTGAPAPAVPRAPDLSLIQALTPDFLQNCIQAQIIMLRPIVQRVVPNPDVPVESEADRRLNALATFFPERFAFTQPHPPIFASIPASHVY